MVARIFVHGPGGSGKTFMLKEVILPVYEEYLPGASRGIAAQNSAARLIGGSTFHHMAGLTRGQELLFQKPSKSKKEAIHKKWARLALAFVDEISLTAPNLLAMLHASACYGRMDIGPEDFLDNIFGNVLCQILAGDFLQLNPVCARSLMEAFGIEVPGAPRYEKMEEQQRRKKLDVDEHGLAVFRAFLQNVILFRGSHRFRKGDPLAELLEKMRIVGGQPLSLALKEAIRKQVHRPLGGDPRLKSDFVMHDPAGAPIGAPGFFSRGYFSAVNWDQVARLQQLCAYESARGSFGPTATVNTSQGKAQLLQRGFPPYVSKSFNLQYGTVLRRLSPLLESLMYEQGRLLYYVQAVDLVHQAEFANDKSVLREILSITNMATKTGNLMSFLPLHIGLKVKVTKKLLPPEIVQECPAEIIAIQMHPNERFGIPGAPAGGSVPAPSHPCWQSGFVRLDYLPASVTIRIEVGGVVVRRRCGQEILSLVTCLVCKRECLYVASER